MRRTLLSLSLLAALLFVGCTSTPRPSAEEVMEITRRVADWQIETYEDQGKYRALPPKEDRKKWHHRERYHDLEWLSAPFFAGLGHLAVEDNYNKEYTDFLMEIGNKHKWSLYERKFHADDHAVGRYYLDMYYRYQAYYMLKPLRAQFTDIMTGDRKDKWHWTWCDALYMAPPVWSSLAKNTGDMRFLEYMDTQYHMTYDKLWDSEEKLFFRDESFLEKTENNGRKLFWARGNGWVFGGLALMIPDMPEDWSGRDFYVTLFKEMASSLKRTQRADGTWSAGLLGDVKDYPNIETSGTAFFVYGLAWGLNSGILDRATYEPIMLKGWNALAGAVTPEGMLGYVQAVGAAPGTSYPNYTELYGNGAFLFAGVELYRYINKFYPEPIKVKPSEASHTFLRSGGWCWYQDPRAVISNGKLVVGGLDGISGDVRVGVFDLEQKSLDGEVVLDKKLQRDDHDAPAFYVRPDGSILTMWAKHGNDKIHRYKISSKDNYLDWGEKQTFKHVYDFHAGVTYMNIYNMEKEGRLYNFFRDGLTFNPSFITSDDQGETWGNRTHFIANEINGRHRPYVRYNQIDANTVGISYTDGHPRDFGNSLYYAEFRDGAFYKVDGTKIRDIKDGPLKTSEGEKVYKGSEEYNKTGRRISVVGSSWSCATSKDAEGNPHLGYTLYLSNEDHRFRIVSWDGDKWQDREIAYAGACLYSVESSYTGLMAFDPVDPRMVYISTDVNPSTGERTSDKYEIYGACIEASDDISTIKWEAITKNSQKDNLRPLVVEGDGHKVLMWLHGDWDTFTHYDVDVVGEIL
ncbi:MAG: glycoside hydrolase family 88 protein [Rikenellaceae bacterium]